MTRIPSLSETREFAYFSGRSDEDKRRYLDHLSLTNRITAQIDKNTKDIIGNDRELAEAGWRVSRENTEYVQKAIQTGNQMLSESIENSMQAMESTIEGLGEHLSNEFVELNQSLEDVRSEVALQGAETRRSISLLSCAVDLRLAQVLGAIGTLNASLEALIEIAKTPSKTWAFEQFDMARDASKRSLYPEALEFLERAINGHGSQTGDKLEHRFYLLRGGIYLGNSDEASHEVIDIDRAQQDFASAERYARGVVDEDCSFAITMLGYISLMRNEVEESKKLFERATAIFPANATAEYYLSKALVIGSNFEKARDHLTRAIVIDPAFSLKAAAEGFSATEQGATVLSKSVIEAQRELGLMVSESVEVKKSALETLNLYRQKVGPALAYDRIRVAPESAAESLLGLWGNIQKNCYLEEFGESGLPPRKWSII